MGSADNPFSDIPAADYGHLIASGALGSRSGWPRALGNIVDVIAASPFPMFVLWGEERIMLYNAAYVPILGDRHPAAMAQPFFDVWPEVRDVIEPVIADAFSGKSSLFEDLPVTLYRPEPNPAWFTFAYSPIKDDTGSIGGALCVCTETTEGVRARRRLAFLLKLEERFRSLESPGEVIGFAQAALGEHLQVSRVGYGHLDAGERYFTTQDNWTDGSVEHFKGTHDLAAFGDEIYGALRSGEALAVEDARTDPRVGAGAAAFEALQTRSAATVSLIKGGRFVAALYVHHREPRRWTEEDIALIRDVAERTWSAVGRAESEALRHDREERLLIAMDAAQMGTWDWDLVAGRGSWSERTAEIMGVAPGQEITPEMRYNSIHPDDRDWVGRAVAESIQSGRDFVTEYRIVRPDGEVRWVASRGRVQMDANGRALRTTGTVRDVTRRRRAQDELQQLNNRLEQEVAERTAERDRMWRLSRDLFVVVGRRREIRAINPAVERLLGYDSAALIGQRFAVFVHPDDLREAGGSIRAAALEPVGDFRARLRSKDGKWREFSWTAAPADGEAYVIGRDITAEVERTRDLELAQDALRESQKLEALGKLTGGVAHDFNNLLTPIVGSLDLLSRAEGLNERQQRLVGAGLESAERARTLVQRLLAFARRQPLKVGPVDMASLIGGMADLIGSTSGPHISLRVQVDAGLPPAQADTNQLELAILNLAVNARDAMPDGGTLSITAALETLDRALDNRMSPGRYVRISVADTGTGMDADTLARAVEPFFSTKGVGKGTGLGLSMVDGLASQLGGAMLIDSRPGLGTCVNIYLPVSTAALPLSQSEEGDRAQPAASGTILLVDDDEAARTSTRELLEDLGYRVEEAESGQEALARLEEGGCFDAVLSDQLMPGITGSELAARIGMRWPGMRVLLVSGYADLDSISPDVPRLAKPFKRDQLRKELQALGI